MCGHNIWRLLHSKVSRSGKILCVYAQSCLPLCNPTDGSCSVRGGSRQESWNRLPCSTPGDLSDSGTKLASLVSPALAGGFFTTAPPEESRKPLHLLIRWGTVVFLNWILVFWFRPLFTKPRLLFYQHHCHPTPPELFSKPGLPSGCQSLCDLRVLFEAGVCFLQLSSGSPQRKPLGPQSQNILRVPLPAAGLLAVELEVRLRLLTSRGETLQLLLPSCVVHPLRGMVLTILCLHSSYLFAVVPSLYHIFFCRGLSC